MPPYIKPSENLIGCTLNNNWYVASKYVPPYDTSVIYSSCYNVTRGKEKGFLKAFDYSDLNKAGGRDHQKRVSYKFNRELSMLKKCQAKEINSVIKLITDDRYYFKPNDINELVEYFILEHSDDGNVLDCLLSGNLTDFENKFHALMHIFEGLEQLHLNGIMHLDLKAQNLVHFVNERLTKITDFGSARQFINDMDDDLMDDLNNIGTTRHYAPPECLYNEVWTDDWNAYRRKIDLYLVGNIIVKLFTNFSFTTLLQKAITEFYDWDVPLNQNNGKLKQYLPHLTKASSEVYLRIEEQLKVENELCGSPLNNKNIDDLMEIISELCKPDANLRGHPKELERKNNRDGLDRYIDKFRHLKNTCAAMPRQ